MSEVAGDECELCGRVAVNSVVDHCHACGTIRGRICRSCNRRLTGWTVHALGVPELLVHFYSWGEKARRYLSHFPGEACALAAARGVAYRDWIAAGRPIDWQNTYIIWDRIDF
jgi:hypothetical protein